jgi:hypothetical protein
VNCQGISVEFQALYKRDYKKKNLGVVYPLLNQLYDYIPSSTEGF